MPSNALIDEDTSPTRNSAIGIGGTAGSKAAGTWTQGESVVVQLNRPLLFEGERVTIHIVDSETNSLVMDRTVRIQNPKRFQFGPEGGATVTDETAPGENVTVNGSVGTPNGTLGDLPNVSTDPGDGGSTPGDSDDGMSDSNPDVGTGDGDGDDEPQPKADLDCGFASRTASGGYACVGDQTDSNDDSSTGGYTKACSDDTNCAPAGSSGNPKSVAGDGGDGDGVANPAFPNVGSGGGRGSSGGSSGGGGGSSGGGTVGGGSSGGHSSGGNGDSGAIGPGL